MAVVAALLLAGCGPDDDTTVSGTDVSSVPGAPAMSSASVPLSSGPVDADGLCGLREVALEVDSNGAFVVPKPDRPVAEWVASSFCAPWTVTDLAGASEDRSPAPILDTVAAECVAGGLIDAFGEDAVLDLGLGSWPWSLLGFALVNSDPPDRIGRAEAESVAAVFEACTADWELVLVNGVTSGADRISVESAQCAAQRLDDDVSREMLVTEIDRAYDDPEQPDAARYPDNVAPLMEVFEKCLTDSERSALDWY